MAGSLLTAFFAETAIVSYRAYHNGISIPAQAPINVPIPAQYTSVVIAFGALALIPGEGARVAGAIGWGLVVATLLNLWSPAGKAGGTGAATYKAVKPAANPPNAGSAPVTPTPRGTNLRFS